MWEITMTQFSRLSNREWDVVKHFLQAPAEALFLFICCADNTRAHNLFSYVIV